MQTELSNNDRYKKLQQQHEEEINSLKSQLSVARMTLQDVESLKLQLSSKENEESKWKTEFEHLKAQLTFKDKELKESEKRQVDLLKERDNLEIALSNDIPVSHPHSQQDQLSPKTAQPQKPSNNKVLKNKPSATIRLPNKNNANKRKQVEHIQEEESKKQKTEITQENDLLRKNVSQLKNRLKIVKKALNGEFDEDIRQLDFALRDELSEVMKRELEKFNKDFQSSRHTDLVPNQDTTDQILSTKLMEIQKERSDLAETVEVLRKQQLEFTNEKQQEIDKYHALTLENEAQRQNILQEFNKSTVLQQQIEQLQKKRSLT